MKQGLAWLLQRAPNIILIPGKSVKHLRENLDAAALELRLETTAGLDLIADDAQCAPS
jgi:pyridoxine 4-dehydrogenase